MNNDFYKTMESSEEWEKATDAINVVIDIFNLRGQKMTEEEKDGLRALRILAVLKNDEKIFHAFSNNLYDELKKG